MTDYKILDDDFDVEKLRTLDAAGLQRLSEEIRQRIVEVCGVNGGHLASSLGAVELAIALHFVLDTPADEIVWDVGHQAYAHKIITGRNRLFATLRQKKGMSGFLKREESVFDVYNAGHTSTSVSAAAGLCAAREMSGESHRIVAVIGDGAMTGGAAFEGLNFIGSRGWDHVIVVVNDNQMSIDRNVGALAKYYNRAITSGFYTGLRKGAQRLLKYLPAGGALYEYARRMEESVKSLLIKGAFYEDLGFTYIGPVDGHDIRDLVRFIKKAGDIKGPVLLHVTTKKGKGYAPAEEDPEGYHGIAAVQDKVRCGETYTAVFSNKMAELGAGDGRIVALTAAMPTGTGLALFRDRFPERYFDTGITEQSAVIIATSMALKGYRPFFAVYSTFLQRAYDQLIHDTALMKAPVRFVIDRGGLVGRDGPTHHGIFDIAFMRSIPGMTLMLPRDSRDLRKMLDFMAGFDEGPSAVRYPRGEAAVPFTEASSPVVPGRGEEILRGDDVTIVAAGCMVRESFGAAMLLREQGISAGVIDIRFIKPLDTGLIAEAAERCALIVTAENGCVKGGFGEEVAAFIASGKKNTAVMNIGIGDGFAGHGGQDEIMADEGLDARSITERILDWKRNGWTAF